MASGLGCQELLDPRLPFSRPPNVFARRAQLPRRWIGQLELQQVVEAGARGLLPYRCHDLHPAAKVARTQVRAADVVLVVAGVGEVKIRACSRNRPAC